MKDGAISSRGKSREVKERHIPIVSHKEAQSKRLKLEKGNMALRSVESQNVEFKSAAQFKEI